MNETKLMFIHCLTGTHPGSGSTLGVVDLPVQRERHTLWPVIPGSSLKGILRSTCKVEKDSDDYELYISAFGPEPRSVGDLEEVENGDNTENQESAETGKKFKKMNEFAGAVSITDARILAFPVRSMCGVFAWTTCPSALKILKRNYENNVKNALPEIADVKPNNVLCSPNSPLILPNENKILLEEFDFNVEIDSSQDILEIANWISNIAITEDDKDTADRIRSHLVILNDDNFTHFTRFATEINARIRLDYYLKSVKDGALFYEESLPPETIFQALVIASDSRKKNSSKRAGDMLKFVDDKVNGMLQIGAGETVGKGICNVRFSDIGQKGNKNGA